MVSLEETQQEPTQALVKGFTDVLLNFFLQQWDPGKQMPLQEISLGATKRNAIGAIPLNLRHLVPQKGHELQLNTQVVGIASLAFAEFVAVVVVAWE